MPRKNSKNVGPRTLRNTKGHIVEVDYSNLEYGKYYLIQHKKEGLRTITTPSTTDDPNKYITRFKGKFVELNYGKSYKYPQGLPNGRFGIPNDKHVAVFEDVKIISKPKEIEMFTNDIYIIKPSNTLSILDIAHNNPDKYVANRAMRKIITSNEFRIAFSTGSWTFGETNQNPIAEQFVKLEPEYTKRNYQEKLYSHAYGDDRNPLYDAFNHESTGKVISSFLDVEMPKEEDYHLATGLEKGGSISRIKRKTRGYKRSKPKSSRKNRTMKH